MKLEELRELREKHPKAQRATDKNVDSIRSHLVTYQKNKPFVFISYKSEDWYVVLHEIVFILVCDYGLNVYYDGGFDDHLPNWIEQFPPNMSANNCRAVLTFRSDRYDCSYAALMEVMYSRGKMCERLYDGKNQRTAMTLLPINLTQSMEVTDEEAERDTGLGVAIYADHSYNEHYKEELERFNESFEELTARGIIKEGKYLYKPKSSIPAEKTLTYQKCSAIMKELFAGKVNNNDYPMGEGERSRFFANLTTMLRDIDPRVFDSDRARLKPGEDYVPESGTTAEKDKALRPTSADEADSWGRRATESDVCRITGNGYDASFTYTAVVNAENETKYRITLLKGSKVKVASHIKTEWKYDKKHRSDIDESSGILKKDIPDLTTSAAECIIKGGSCSGKAIRYLIENAVLDATETPTAQAPVSAERKIGGVCTIAGNGYDASFTYTAVIDAKNETKYRITLHKGSKVKVASHMKTGWKYGKKHRSDIDESSGILKRDIPDLTTSAAESFIRGNSRSGETIRSLIEEAESKI